MKIVILKGQYKRLIETEEEQKVLRIPSLKVFSYDIFKAWNILQKLLEKKGNPPYSIGGDLDLSYSSIQSLGNLVSVSGNVKLTDTPIKSLGPLRTVGGYLNMYNTPIVSLGNLRSVGMDLDISRSSVKSFGDLEFVGRDLYLFHTPLSEMYSPDEISEMVDIQGFVYLLY